MSAISLLGAATFERIKLEILTCQIRAQVGGLTPRLLPRRRRLRLAILVGIHFERTGLRIWMYQCSGIFLLPKEEVFSSGRRRLTSQTRRRGEFRSTT